MKVNDGKPSTHGKPKCICDVKYTTDGTAFNKDPECPASVHREKPWWSFGYEKTNLDPKWIQSGGKLKHEHGEKPKCEHLKLRPNQNAGLQIQCPDCGATFKEVEIVQATPDNAPKEKPDRPAPDAPRVSDSGTRLDYSDLSTMTVDEKLDWIVRWLMEKQK